METVEPGRKGALQPPHAFGQIRLRRLHRQMVVLAHDHIRVELARTALGRLEDASLKGLRRLLVLKRS